MIDKNKLYQDLFKAMKLASLTPKGKGDTLQKKCTEEWTKLKNESNGDDSVLQNKVNMAIFACQAEVKRRESRYFSFYTGVSSNAPVPPHAASPPLPTQSLGGPESGGSDVDDPGHPVRNVRKTPSKPAPAQAAALERIVAGEERLSQLQSTKDSGLANPDIDKEIKETRKALEADRKLLLKRRGEAERSRKSREKKKRNLAVACAEHPDVAAKLMRASVGRPRITEEQPDLLKAIVDIAMFASGAEERRQDERMRSCMTLDELTEDLQGLGFTVSRSGVYLHLLPHNPKTREGERHVNTVPVKLARPSNNAHKHHVDGKFATASIRYLETLAATLGPDQVLFISQDDKARVPLGKTAAKVQAPILMSLQYRVSLPDHDFPVGPRHVLIPSVMAVINIKEEEIGRPEAVTYSGPTYVCIRSGKHSSSTANTHADDFRRLVELEEFRDCVKTTDGQVKPVVMFTVDGGPDECPRYRKNIAFAVDHFKQFNLDAIFIAANAAGRSAYNRVERRMAPLSRRMAGLILPHDYFGTHLNSQGDTIDEELEKRNFRKASEILAEKWSDMTIDKFPVKATYIEPGESELPPDVDGLWYAQHVRESQYLLQIIKCNSVECCGPHRSSIASVLRHGFLPPPIRVTQTTSGLKVVDPDEEGGHYLSLFTRLGTALEAPHAGFRRVPYDLYCPSVRRHLAERVCKVCGVYFVSQSNLRDHTRMVHGRNIEGTARARPHKIVARRATELLCVMRMQHQDADECLEWLEEDDVDVVGVQETMSEEVATNEFPVIPSIGEWIASPWQAE